MGNMRKEIAFGLVGVVIGAVIVGLAYGTNSVSEMEMHGAMDAMTATLEPKQGADFEHAFLMEMVVHHEGAVAMAEQVLEKSQRAELRKLAEDIIAAQTSEIAQMRQWMNEWFGH